MKYLLTRLGIAAATLTVLLSVFSFGVVHAQADPKDPLRAACKTAANDPNTNAAACKAGNNNPLSGPNGLIMKAASLLMILVGIASIIMIILGGYTYVMSNGDTQKTKAGKDTIMYAVIGLVIAASGQAIISFVLNKL